MTVRYQNIDAATTAMGYGTLVGMDAKLHACGRTTTGDIVWLPIMYDPDNNWYNMYDCNTSRELIIQIAHKKPAIRDWRVGVLVAETAHTIVKTNKREDGTYEYEDIGEYCDILFDSSRHLSIHAKLGASVTAGNELRANGLKWVSGFAASEHEARVKLDALVGATMKMLREC
ncbi:MAG: hypothetical protein Pg6C_17660 [Treponemataceae bacterium]|nr:MAG: hypothetical protein Pg6C_17660 [Treponemataceae bacterium]